MSGYQGIHERRENARVPRMARRDWRDLARSGYAIVGADGVPRVLVLEPSTGGTVLTPVEIVPDAIIYREG